MLAGRKISDQEAIFSLSPKDVSFFLGHRNKNIQTLKQLFRLTGIHVSVDPAHARGTLAMLADGRKSIKGMTRH